MPSVSKIYSAFLIESTPSLTHIPLFIPQEDITMLMDLDEIEIDEVSFSYYVNRGPLEPEQRFLSRRRSKKYYLYLVIPEEWHETFDSALEDEAENNVDEEEEEEEAFDFML